MLRRAQYWLLRQAQQPCFDELSTGCFDRLSSLASITLASGHFDGLNGLLRAEPEPVEGVADKYNELIPNYRQGFARMKKGYMYILKCSDDTYYVGSTTDLERRLAEHQAGIGAKYTRNRLPVTLVYYEEYDRIDEAFLREKQVKKWRRAKKEALINGDLQQLPELSKAYGKEKGKR